MNGYLFELMISYNLQHAHRPHNAPSGSILYSLNNAG